MSGRTDKALSASLHTGPIEATTTRLNPSRKASSRPDDSATRHRCCACVAEVNMATSTCPSATASTARSSGPTSSGSAHRYTGTGCTFAPRLLNPSSSSGLLWPYSCTATVRPLTGACSSSAANTSRQVLGSGTVTVGVTPSLRKAAIGFGPRATVVTRPKAAAKRSAGWCCATASTSVRRPTPVSSTTTSISPAISRSAKRIASVLSSSGTSRIDGAIHGTPPCRSIKPAISSARRLSNDRIRRASVSG